MVFITTLIVKSISISGKIRFNISCKQILKLSSAANSKCHLPLFSDEDFLQVINSSSVKDLQSLQTVGAKRAKLIFDWRQTYGSFSDVSAYNIYTL